MHCGPRSSHGHARERRGPHAAEVLTHIRDCEHSTWPVHLCCHLAGFGAPSITGASRLGGCMGRHMGVKRTATTSCVWRSLPYLTLPGEIYPTLPYLLPDLTLRLYLRTSIWDTIGTFSTLLSHILVQQPSGTDISQTIDTSQPWGASLHTPARQGASQAVRAGLESGRRGAQTV